MEKNSLQLTQECRRKATITIRAEINKIEIISTIEKNEQG